MADIKDRQGRIIQRQTTSHDGTITARDAQGRLLGTYNPKTNRTVDYQGRIVGSGNLLAALG